MQGNSILADLGTEQMEFIALTQRTNISKYKEKVCCVTFSRLSCSWSSLWLRFFLTYTHHQQSSLRPHFWATCSSFCLNCCRSAPYCIGSDGSCCLFSLDLVAGYSSLTNVVYFMTRLRELSFSSRRCSPVMAFYRIISALIPVRLIMVAR